MLCIFQKIWVVWKENVHPISSYTNVYISKLQIDIDQPLVEQGPFNLILHKCTGLMVAAKDGDLTAEDQINNIKVSNQQ